MLEKSEKQQVKIINSVSDFLKAKNVWRQHALSADNERYYGFTKFAIELNEILPQHEASLPHTDSRWRPDQQLLEQGTFWFVMDYHPLKGRIHDAENEKKRVEDIQRKAARKRESLGVKYEPRFFKQDDNGEYRYVGDSYWEQHDNQEFWRKVERLW